MTGAAPTRTEQLICPDREWKRRTQRRFDRAKEMGGQLQGRYALPPKGGRVSEFVRNSHAATGC
jgi:hypothetical protein